MRREIFAAALAAAFALQGCAKRGPGGNAAKKAIADAQTLPFFELYKKAAEESDGKVLRCIANSSRGKAAGESFIKELKKINPYYSGQIDWQVPKNSAIFSILREDIHSDDPQYSMTLIQDGNLIQSEMLDTGLLLNYIPKEWSDAGGTNEEEDGHPFALQTLNKVFEFNNRNRATRFDNCWDFVYADAWPLFMDLDAEPVGWNFLYMLTRKKYSSCLESAYSALDPAKKSYFDPIVEGMAKEARHLGFKNANAKYALAFIKLWVDQHIPRADDGVICEELADNSGAGKCGLLVYSKFRSVKETQTSSINNVTVAAYQNGYKGIGGYAYKHYLQVTKTAPLPYTACAFIMHMTTQIEGFYPWGKDIGGYCSNPAVNQNHKLDGFVDGKEMYPAKNDRGYTWWVDVNDGALVIENPAYCAKVSQKLSEWIAKNTTRRPARGI